MRKKGLCALMISLCLLVSCGHGTEETQTAEQLALEIRTELLGMTACTATAKLTADYGQRVYECTLDAAYSAETGGTLTVVEPALIAGVTVRIAPGSSVLEYDGISLETGPLTDSGLTPVGALPALLAYGRNGYISQCGFETRDEQLLLRVFYTDPEGTPGEGTEGALWFGVANHNPVAAELYENGELVLGCDFTAFERTSAPAAG
ncbi:MAG: hypothetical protein RSC08_02485 [Oscillospiraceae bacterium]